MVGGRGGDLARVAKGAGKVARAFLQVEGPVVARQALRLKDHGGGLAYSLKNAVSLAVSSTQHQNANVPPDGNSTGTSDPDSGVSEGVGVGINGNGLSAAVTEDIPSALRQQTASTRLEDGDPTADAAGAVKIKLETPPAATTPSVTAKVEASTAEPTKSVTSTSNETPPAGVDDDNALAESMSLGDPDATLASSTSGVSSVTDKEQERGKGKTCDKTNSAEAGPWAFAAAAAAADSEYAGGARVGASMADGLPTGGAAPQARGGGGMMNSRTRTVPSSPLARVFGFGQLAAGLAMGTVAEAVRQSVRGGNGQLGGGGAEGGERRSSVKQYVASDANAERLAETLCRMRGAALKLGQMLSIQDESVIPPSLAKALDRVRQGADVMPTAQLYRQLEKSLGVEWRSRLKSFDETPIAAASIGQVHRAQLLDGTEVAMKIQYPGVADSVESDLKNLQRLVQLTNILPPGLYIDEIIKVAREELGEECDYEREAANQDRFRKLVESDENLNRWCSVPMVVHELVGKEVLTTHLAPGVPVDQILPMPQEVRNHVARLMLRCTINELFDWRFMQTDPNWGNFLFDRETGKMSLIDFGACREYRKEFVDDYLKLVWSAANRDDAEIMRVSQKLKFLTGDETKGMMKAHLQAGLVVGEPFVDRGGEAFDFHGSNITARLSQHGDTFMKHRLTPPPQEAYSLHRKLAGAFLMNIKLQAVIPCRDILEEVHGRYTFG